MVLRHQIDGSEGSNPSPVCHRVLPSAIRGLHEDERGATATEYVVLLVLVAAALIAVIATFGEQIERLYNQAVETLRRDVANR